MRLLLFVFIALSIVALVMCSNAEQQIDDLRPKTTVEIEITDTWSISVEKFADSGDFGYYREVYESGK